MRIEDEWLRAPPTQAVFGMLERAGHRALAVGGCVRDALLGLPVGDIDIATDAPPDTVVALAEATGLRAVPTGIAHGTVTVVAAGIPHEVTTFRRDVETDGRHAVVAFGTDVAEDAARRDFTMNALYADASGTVVDPLGGFGDLRARHVRFIGDPATRIAEDHLRILRFFRFTARYGDPSRGIDADGLAACAALAEGLDRLSRERVGHEMRRLLSAPDPAPALTAMARAGILARVLPGAEAAELGAMMHLAPDADWLARLALLGGEAEGLRLSNAEARTLTELRDGARRGTAPFALGHALGASRARDALAVRAALTGRAVEGLDAAEAGAVATFPLSASDLMPGLAGSALGEGLARARALWLDREGRVSRDDLVAAARG